MKRVVGLVCLVLALAACQTTESTKSTSKKPKLITSVKSLGWFVGYSEICNFHRGKSVDDRILAHFKKINENNDDFDAGYRLNSSLVGSDRVIGLDQCDYVNESLKLSYKRYNNWIADPQKPVRTVSADRKSHVLTLEWEETDERIAYETYVTSPTNKHRISDYFEIKKGQFCKFEWIFESEIKGNWKYSCDNGETGKGVFGSNKLTDVLSGYGKVKATVYGSNQNQKKLDFTFVPLSRKS